MRTGPLAASLLALLLFATEVTSSPQQAGKKPKSAIASAIDGAAGSVSGGGRTSPLAEDGEFLRRVMLDLVGTPPNLEEVKAFIADANPNKRSDKIDQLLDS